MASKKLIAKLFSLLLFSTILISLASATTVTVFGDSFSDPNTFNSDYSHKYDSIVAANHSYIIDNRAYSGQTIQAQANHVRVYNSSRDTSVWWNSGVGDANVYGTDPVGMNCYNATLESLLAWLAIPASNKIIGTSMNYVSGSWGITKIYNGETLTSATPGSAVKCTLYGDTVYISYLRFNTSGTKKFDLYIDDNYIQTVDCQGGATLPPNRGSIDFSPKLLRVYGLSQTAHTVKTVVNSSSMSCVTIDWIAGFNQSTVTPSTTKIYLINVPPFVDPATVSTNAAYDEMIKRTVDTLNHDGLNISLVDIFTGYNASTMAKPDGLHPNDAGNVFIAQKLENAFLTPVTVGNSLDMIKALISFFKNIQLHIEGAAT